MTEGLNWGLPIILYLFLAGMGAGAVTVSSSMLLRGGGGGRGVHHEIARYGALLGPLPVIFGTGLLVLELGSFEAGNYFRFLNLYTVMNLSPMSVGTWLLTVFMATCVVYAYTYIHFVPFVLGDRMVWRRRMAVIKA